MKKGLFLLLLGAVLGVIGWRYYQRAGNSTVGQRLDQAADKARAVATEAKQAGPVEGGKNTSEKIQEELAETGKKLRSEARTVGELADDARIVAIIKGKYMVDSNLSVLAISVDCRAGEVKLTGSVTAEEYIGRAVNLARQTHGVRNVIPLLVVKN